MKAIQSVSTSTLPVVGAGRAVHWGGDSAWPPLAAEHPVLPADRDFELMCSAYLASGGIARGDDLTRMLEAAHQGAYVSVAKHIAAGELFSFSWHHNMWVPMFQFDLPSLAINTAAQRAVAELAPVFDGWAMGMWFAQPNSWLAGRRPVDLLASDLREVLRAACADRFIAAG